MVLTLFGLALLLSGGCAAPWTPPTPSEILAKPSQSSMKDGHFRISGHITSGAYASDVSGEGTMVMQPRYAFSMRLQGSIGQIPFAVQQVDVNGKSYSRVGSAKWTKSDARNEPGNPSGARAARLIGEESLSAGKSWRVRAVNSSGQTFDMWVRESDGYLVKYAGTSDTGSISIEFDRYNTGETVSAPAASDIKPPARQLTGKVGDALQLNGLTVTVVTADLNAKPGNQFIQPKAGDRFVVVQVLYENTGSESISYNPFDWKLSDASGFSYSTAYPGVAQELQSGSLSSGEKARGYISYEVPQSASGLSMKFQRDDDTASVTLG
jgi:Domain of unknown function (DUF4352)